jgi:hypothetical protein
MAQSYVDNDTMQTFEALFKGKDKEGLKEQMETLKNKISETHTLQGEATGETLEEARKALQEQNKLNLYK